MLSLADVQADMPFTVWVKPRGRREYCITGTASYAIATSYTLSALHLVRTQAYLTATEWVEVRSRDTGTLCTLYLDGWGGQT